MKIKLPLLLTVIYFILILIFLKTFSILSIILFIITIILDHFTKIKNGIINLLYFLAALSVFTPIFSIFLLYLPFAVFGFLLRERNFIRDYVLGFAISFVPSTLIYLISTYLSIPLSYPVIALIFYSLPVIAFFILRKRSFDFFEIDTKNFIFALIVLFFTVIIAINIVDDKNLFMANGAREFFRVDKVIQGLDKDGLIPLYNPGIGTGEATYLFVPPTSLTHFGLTNYLLKFIPPILFFNSHLFFILFLSVSSLSVLFYSIIKNKSNLNMMAVTAVSLLVGLNFLILQSMESSRSFYGYPIAHLFLSLIIGNPKRFNDFIILMYFLVLILLIHPAFGVAMFLFAGSLFFIRKLYYFKDQDEIKYFLKWISKNKLKLLTILVIISLLPVFYVSTPFLFKYLLKDDPGWKLNYQNLKASMSSYFNNYSDNELSFLSLGYPDVNRIDDHKFGFFVSVFGVISFFLLLLLFRVKSLKNFRIFAFGYMLHILATSIAYIKIFRFGGFFRTPGLYLLTLLGASILAVIFLVNKKYLKLILIGIVFGGFLHSVPYAQQNITNIHREAFMGGDIYTNELAFIKQLPIDGRIMSYGLFDSVIDYGINYLTGRYGSRSERTEGQVERMVYTKIHNQNSWGTPDDVLGKSGTELSNYLILGGYKYLFMNIGHPMGNYVIQQIYPNFSYPLYQNGPLVFLAINNTNYAEKIDLVQSVNDETYKQEDGYKYRTISTYYDLGYEDIEFKEVPKEPVPLEFERVSATKVRIFGDFEDGEWVVFKEQHFPRWRAYMNNQEVPVLPSEHVLILIKTIKGNEILLEYSPLPKEKIVGIISLIGFIGFFGFLVFLLKQDSAIEKIQH